MVKLHELLFDDIMANNILCFKVVTGIASGWTVFLTEKCLLQHKNNYGNLRPYLNDLDFINNKIKQTMEDPSFVKQDVEVDQRTKKIKTKKNVVVFYKEFPNNKFKYIDKPNSGIMEYIRIVCFKNSKEKTLSIATPLITPRINKKKISPTIKTLD